MLLVGCAESQQSTLPPKVEPAEPVDVATKPEPTTAKALYKIEDRQGLLGHWKFEGNVSDSSGNDNDGVAIGGPGFGEGKIGKALKLNGLSQRVELPKLASGIDQLTIAIWINVDHMPSSEKFVSIYHNKRVDGG